MRFIDRAAIVTGASMGVGASVTRELAQRGARVFAFARSEDKLQKLAEENPRIIPVVGDVTVAEDRARLLETAGEVDILINNAGLASFGNVAEQAPAEIQHMFDVNVLALIDMTQRVLPGMLHRKNGHICNVGSVISHVATPQMTVYASTKFAVEGFSDGLRRELAGTGVNVSLIQPGPVATAFWDRGARGDRPDVAEGGNGIPAQWVSNAIVRAIRFDRVPGYATVGVPRALGVARVLDVPGVSYALDLVAGVIQLPGTKSERKDAPVIPLHRDTK